MNSQPRRVDVRLQTKLESVDLGEELARRMAVAAGFEEDEQHKIAMSVRESLINAFQHGNRQDVRKQIGLRFLLYPNRLVVEVSDEGPGFRLEDVPNPLADESLLRSSGRGLFLIRSFMDECQVESGRNGGARVTIVKHLPAPAPQTGEQRVEEGRER